MRNNNTEIMNTDQPDKIGNRKDSIRGKSI